MATPSPFDEHVEFPFVAADRFGGLLGLVVTELSDERARGHAAVRDDLKQPGGLIHGGVYASIAESLASWATMRGVMPQGKLAVGLSNHTSFIRPVIEGTIHAVAVRKHRGRTTWLWEVECSDDAGRLCVLTRVTVAVRDLPAPDSRAQ